MFVCLYSGLECSSSLEKVTIPRARVRVILRKTEICSNEDVSIFDVTCL